MSEFCKSLPDLSERNHCFRSMRKCNEDTSSSADLQYCESLVAQCYTNDPETDGRIPLHLDADSTEYYSNSYRCVDFASFRGLLGVPANPYNPPVTKTRKGAATGDELRIPDDISGYRYNGCRNDFDSTSQAFIQCIKWAGFCISQGSGPYTIPNSEINMGSLGQCIEMALFKTKLDVAEGKISDSAFSSSEARSSSSLAPAKFRPDYETRFARTFSDLNFQLEIAKEVIIQPIKLRFSGGKTILRIYFAYIVERNSDGSYLLKYRISKSSPDKLTERELGKKFPLTVKDDEIQESIAFGIVLKESGDFTDVESIEVVDL